MYGPGVLCDCAPGQSCKGPFGMPDSIRPDRIRADSIRPDCIRPDKNLILCSVWYITV